MSAVKVFHSTSTESVEKTAAYTLALEIGHNSRFA